jgi:hypothetical protein
MNRRTFLQSLIAVPLAAVGMPRVNYFPDVVEGARQGRPMLSSSEIDRYVDQLFQEARIDRWEYMLTWPKHGGDAGRFLPNG